MVAQQKTHWMEEALKKWRERRVQVRKSFRQGQFQANSVAQWAKLFEHWPRFMVREIMNLSAKIIEPSQWISGVRITHWDNNRLEVYLPWRTVNRHREGAVKPHALIELADYAARLLWEYALLDRKATIERTGLSLSDYVQSHSGDVWARLEIDPTEKEKILEQLGRFGKVKCQVPVSLYNRGRQMISQVTFTWWIIREKQEALRGSPRSEKDDTHNGPPAEENNLN